MKNSSINKMSGASRVLILIAAAMLVVSIFVPLWRIDLDAPQYPEGLYLLIYTYKLAGNVDIINGLNHYIGMKTLHAEDFIEFTVLPYIIGVYALFTLIVALAARKKLLFVLLAAFALFGILSMIDFWRWEYDYGHNLDPNAAIIVPGMAYQPPLIGFKQLLNFGAFSMPSYGGWLFIASGICMLVAVFIETGVLKKFRKKSTVSSVLLFIVFTTALTSCSAQPKPVKLGIDQCHYCKMSISDARYPAEIITQKGKVYLFDDVHCVIGFLKENKDAKQSVKDIYLADYSGVHKFIKVTEAHLVKSEDFRSPMGGNIAAFENIDSLKKIMSEKNGVRVIWDDIIK
ncbi:MAG: nitrous oxide reductase accessory protein NosL [Sphingobacteriales bacterium]|nr:nitrous oxide reductase accessory protein NosL [Sphingobacteriales bacterium]